MQAHLPYRLLPWSTMHYLSINYYFAKHGRASALFQDALCGEMPQKNSADAICIGTANQSFITYEKIMPF